MRRDAPDECRVGKCGLRALIRGDTIVWLTRMVRSITTGRWTVASVYFRQLGRRVELESDRGRYDVCSTGCCKNAFMLLTHSGDENAEESGGVTSNVQIGTRVARSDEMLEVATVFG